MSNYIAIDPKSRFIYYSILSFVERSDFKESFHSAEDISSNKKLLLFKNNQGGFEIIVFY